MPRVKTGTTRHARHQKVLKKAKGYRMSYSRTYKRAKEATLHAGEYSFAARKKRPGQFRRLWIQRINAALSQIEGAPKYSRFIKALADNKIELNRKILAYLAVEKPPIFEAIVQKASQ